ncbi:MAG: Bug family tripartite tricarboxylate transporter substrate binding protein, partial [Casimicrobium sp.]
MKTFAATVRRLTLVASMLAAIATSTVFAQSYPDKPIKLIVPFAAGAGTDAVARFVAQRMESELKQPVVVENKVGASGAIGTQEVARAQAD